MEAQIWAGTATSLQAAFLPSFQIPTGSSTGSMRPLGHWQGHLLTDWPCPAQGEPPLVFLWVWRSLYTYMCINTRVDTGMGVCMLIHTIYDTCIHTMIHSHIPYVCMLIFYTHKILIHIHRHVVYVNIWTWMPVETLYMYMYTYNISILLLHVIHCHIVYIHTYSMFYVIYI